MSINKYSKRDIFLTSGFVCNHSFPMMPSEIIAIIIEYFLEAFEWYTKKCGSNISFSKDNTYVTSVSEIAYDIWAAKNIMDAKKHRMVEWEVTLKNVSDGLYFSMGYVQHPLLQSIEMWNYVWLGQVNEKQMECIFISETEKKFLTCKNGKKANIIIHEKALIKSVEIGDRFEIRFDFDCNQSLFYYNAEFMQVLPNSILNAGNIPLVPAMCCSSPHEFQTTKWSIYYR